MARLETLLAIVVSSFLFAEARSPALWGARRLSGPRRLIRAAASVFSEHGCRAAKRKVDLHQDDKCWLGIKSTARSGRGVWMPQELLERLGAAQMPAHFLAEKEVGLLHDLRDAGYIKAAFAEGPERGRKSATVIEVTNLGRAALRYFGTARTRA